MLDKSEADHDPRDSAVSRAGHQPVRPGQTVEADHLPSKLAPGAVWWPEATPFDNRHCIARSVQIYLGEPALPSCSDAALASARYRAASGL